MTTYPPLDVLKPVGDRIWIVDSGPLHAAGVLPLPVRMTVVRLQDGTIMLHSPTRYEPALRRTIEQIGPIRHLIAPNSAHWSFIKDWTINIPEARAWAAPGLRQRGQVKRANIVWHADLGPFSQASWVPDLHQTEVRGISGFCEVCFFHKQSATLVLTDLVQNLDPSHTSGLMRVLSALTGAKEKAPVYLRWLVKLKGSPARKAARQLVALEPRRVIFSHGAWFEEDASQRLRRSLDWLL